MPFLAYGTEPESFRRRWMPFVAWGAAAVVFGAVVIALPRPSLAVLTALVGLLALAAGVLQVAVALASRRTTPGRWWWISPLPGLLLVAASVFALGWPSLAAGIIVRVLALLAVAWGIADVALGIRVRIYFAGWWVRVLRGTLIAAAGLVVFAAPTAGVVAAAWVLGFWALAVGALSIALGLWLRRIPAA